MNSICLRHLLALMLCCVVARVSHGAQTHFPELLVAPADELFEEMKVTINATKPDYVAFIPRVTAPTINDTGNEHFLVFDGPDGSLMAIWTQSTGEGNPDQHIVFAQSKDDGKTWSAPKLICGPAKPGQGFIASWAYPMVSKSGRIYVLYSQHVGRVDTFFHTTGSLIGKYSDDLGATWSQPETIAMPRTSRDNPDPTMPPNCITWQKPLRLTHDGRYLVGLTRWISKSVARNPTKSWTSYPAVVEFLRFENLDDNPDPAKLKISWLAYDSNALTVPYPGHPETSVCQEPSIVKLPDGRLFCVMRTSAGSPFWTVSANDGDTWSKPKPLLQKDGGAPLRQPLSPCPMFDLGGGAAGSGRYALFIHNHDGHYRGYGPADASYHRRPIYRVDAHFEPNAQQPIWFDAPKFFMDNDGVPLGAPGKRGRIDLALYSSVVVRNGKTILWYPDRKFFLLGKVIADRQ